MRRLAALLAALALLAVGCSGDDNPLDSGQAVLGTTTPPSSAPETVPAPTLATTTTVPRGPGAIVTGRGVSVPVVSHDGDDWTVKTPCNRETTIRGGTFVPYVDVVLDPGHGGSDPGAMSPGGGLRESPLNLAVTEQTKKALEAVGVTVLMTRSADHDVELSTRAQLAVATGARAFVSIHHNAEPDGPWPGPGAETYYQIASPDSKRLAGLIYEEIVKAFSAYQIAWAADRDAGAKYRPGSRGDYYAVLRLPGTIVSALVEGAFISNPPEAALLARPEVQQVEGEAIARGIVRYLRSQDPGSGYTEPYPRPAPPPRTGPPLPPPTCTDPAL